MIYLSLSLVVMTFYQTGSLSLNGDFALVPSPPRRIVTTCKHESGAKSGEGRVGQKRLTDSAVQLRWVFVLHREEQKAR